MYGIMRPPIQLSPQCQQCVYTGTPRGNQVETAVDPSHKSHNASFRNRNVHMCAHFCYEMVHCRIFVFTNPTMQFVNTNPTMQFVNTNPTMQSVNTKMPSISIYYFQINTLRPRQNGHHFADDILKCIFLIENVWIPFEISLKFVPKGSVDNIPALV